MESSVVYCGFKYIKEPENSSVDNEFQLSMMLTPFFNLTEKVMDNIILKLDEWKLYVKYIKDEKLIDVPQNLARMIEKKSC